MSWIVLAILSAIFAALVAIFGKIGLKEVDSTLATTVRAVVMAVFLVALSWILGKQQLLSTINNRVLLFIILSGVAGALSWLFYFFALKIGPAGGVSALDRTSIIFVFILAGLFLGEAFTLKGALGAVMIGLGALLMTLK